ncbi:MAG: LacI family DNA-binding transcriptional regulator [Ferruginibacter sp.]|nr:LacI family DNA-binding transcriptional regulator [Ferruginibacter sp.]
MKIESITITDIAKALNFSSSTVSRALRDSYQISEATKRIVKDYAKKNNYHPNLVAQSLKSNKSKSIGLLLCSVPNNFFAEVISGIESIAYNSGYHIIITQSHESQEREARNLDHLSWRSVDGLLVSLSSETMDMSKLQKIHSGGVPIVFFDRVSDCIKTHQVVADNIEGAYRLTKHLIESGCRNIAHITSSPGLSITSERREGYVKALTEYNIPVNENYIKYCPHGGMIMEEIEVVIQELLNMKQPPDALFTASDRITIGSFAFLHKKNIRIPEQIAIGGFCNFSSPELFNPSLTTIRQPAFEMGKTAAELLIALIESKRQETNFEKKILPTELFVRKSSVK